MANWWNKLFGRGNVQSEPLSTGKGASLYEKRSLGYSLVDPNLAQRWGLDISLQDASPRSAMGIATFFGCVATISDLISSQPFGVYQETETGRRKAREHQLHNLISRRANRSMSAYILRRTLLDNALVWGNGIAIITRDRYNRPTEITPVDSRKVTILEDTSTGYLFYGVLTASAGVKWFSDLDVIHIKERTFDGMKGVAPGYWHSQTIRINLAAKGLQQKTLENGAFANGFVSTSLNIGKGEDAKTYKERIVESLNDGSGLAVIGADAKWIPVTRSPLEVQLIETLSKCDADWHKVFRIPPIMLGDTEKQTSFGSGVEQMFIQVTNSVLIPRSTEIEQEFDYKCFRSDELEQGYYTSINFQNLLRGDSKTRGEYYAKMVGSGVFTQDEIRAWEELGPYPDGAGSDAWIQQSYMPLSKAKEILISKYNGKGSKGTGTEPGGSEGGSA